MKIRVAIAITAAILFITQIVLPMINAAQNIMINTGAF